MIGDGFDREPCKVGIMVADPWLTMAEEFADDGQAVALRDNPLGVGFAVVHETEEATGGVSMSASRLPDRGYDLDSARHEAPCPWRIGGEDDAGIHVLDVNRERVAKRRRAWRRWEVIQALVARIGDEVLVPRLCANPECRCPFAPPAALRCTARPSVPWRHSRM